VTFAYPKDKNTKILN